MLDRINFIQRFIIVHSYIYYELDNNIISDREYDKAGKDLVALKEQYPEFWEMSEYYPQFKDYNGSTGFSLYHELDDKQKTKIRSIARYLIGGLK